MNNQPTATLNTARATTTASGPTVKARQLVRRPLSFFFFFVPSSYPADISPPPSPGPQAQLQSQLGMLSAHLADTDSIVRVTAAQAAYLRELGSWHAGLYVPGLPPPARVLFFFFVFPFFFFRG